MESWFLWLGVLMVAITIYCLIKQYDSRLVLLISGIVMATAANTPMAAFDAFTKSMTNAGIIQNVCSVMGFALVMKITECDKHLISLIANLLAKFRPLLIPGAVIGTFLINIALPSAAGTAAAVGAIFIPLLISAGVDPAMAAASVKSGTYGSMLNPGLQHNVMVAKISGIDVMDVIAFHKVANITSVVLAGIVITILAYFLKEHKGRTPEGFTVDDSFKANLIYALVPIVPLTLLLLGTEIPAIKMSVPASMIIGSIVAFLVTRKNPVKLSNAFFDGMGSAYASIIGIIISAGVFVSGMKAMGLVDAFINTMVNSPSIVKICAAVGPFVLGLLSGSGDAATVAFNEAITPFAAQFGLSPLQMGSMATLGGTLGRTMSPIAGATLICAGIAGVNPMEVAKRTCPGMIVAMIAGMFLLLF